MGVHRTQHPQLLPAPDTWGTAGQDGLRDLFLLSAELFEARDEQHVIRMAMAAVPSLAPCTPEAGYLRGDEGWLRAWTRGLDPAAHVDPGRDPVPGSGPAPGSEPVAGPAPGSPPVPVPAPDPELDVLDEQLSALGPDGGIVRLPGRKWCEALALRSSEATLGFLVVSSASRLRDDEHFLLRALAQQTSAALSNAAGRRAERRHAAALLRANHERGEAIAGLRESVAELEFQKSVHEALSQASTESEEGIADMVRAFTGLPVAVEDPFGNLRVWSGPGCPDPYPRYGFVRREQQLQETMRRAGPVRTGNRLTCIAQHRGKVFGTISLIDPDRTAGRHEVFVLEHACVALALEMSHQRRLAEAELRLRRELVEDLLTGTDADGAYERSEALGHDLHGTHRVVVVEWDGKPVDALAETVGRAAGGLGLRFLVGRHRGDAVLAVRGASPPYELHDAVAKVFGPNGGRTGIGGPAEGPADFPRSYEEALHALAFRRHSRTPAGAAAYDELGFYRILATGEDQRRAMTFVREQLGPLQDYDAEHHTDLVRTLAVYFDCGGNYDEAAAALTIHRSTLRYRLGRIREVGGYDLTDAGTRLNLHVATRIWQVSDGADQRPD